MATLIGWLLASAAVATAVLCAGIMVGKVQRERRAARRAEIESRLRPVLIQLLAEHDVNASTLAQLVEAHGSDGVVIEDMAAEMLPKFRGGDRATLCALLRERGAFERADGDTRHRRAHRRIRGLDLLGNGGHATAIPTLTRLLSDRDIEVRKAAARALGKVGTAESAAVLMREFVAGRTPLSVVGMSLLHIGPAAVEVLISGLSSPEAAERGLAAECLGVMGAIAAVDPLIEHAVSETDAVARAALARALGRLGSPEATPVLISMLGVDDEGSRSEAATALGRIGDPVAVTPLEHAAREFSRPVARAATVALRACGGEGRERLGSLCGVEGSTGALAREAVSAPDLAGRRAG